MAQVADIPLCAMMEYNDVVTTALMYLGWYYRAVAPGGFRLFDLACLEGSTLSTQL